VSVFHNALCLPAGWKRYAWWRRLHVESDMTVRTKKKRAARGRPSARNFTLRANWARTRTTTIRVRRVRATTLILTFRL